MNRFLSIVLFFIFTSSLWSQVDSTKVAFVSYWSIGDSYDFNISKIKKQWKEGKLVKDNREDNIVNFKVIDSTANSYVINWTYKNDLKKNYNIPDELLEKFSKYEFSTVQYKTSEVGDLIEILNWKELRDIMRSMFQDIINFVGEGDKTKQEVLKKAIEPIKELYSSKEAIELLVMKELQYFHYLMGVEYDIREPLFYEEELPSMFGGGTIKSKTKLYFENVNFEEEFCVIKQEMDLDPKDTKKAIKEFFLKMKIGDDKMDEALKTSVFEIKDRNTYEYYYYPGIPHRIETIRESIINMNNQKGRSIDKLIIELIYQED